MSACFPPTFLLWVLTVSHVSVPASITFLYVTPQWWGLSTSTVNVTLYHFQIILIKADTSNQSKDDSEWVTTVTIETNICFSLQGKFHKQTWMLYSATGQQLSWIFGCTVAPSSFHLMGLILPLHFAVLSWQGSQSSQHLLLMPLTGGYLLPYMFSLQLHHGRLEAAKPRCWDADGHLFD